MNSVFQGKSFLAEKDFTKQELMYLIDFAIHLKELKQKNIPHAYLAGKNIALLFVGGLLIGFGTRYAGGCTSGHAISGLSDLQLPSLIAVIGFFIGGLLMVHVLFPLIF